MARNVVRERRRWLFVVGAVVALLALAVSILSAFYIDLLWFREVGFSSVFWSVLTTKIVLGTIFAVLFFALLYANLLIVRRLAPRYRVLSPEQEIIERYRLAFEPYLKWILPLFCAGIALLVGIGASRQWQQFLLWKNSSGVGFDVEDPLFHRDPAFYIFDLPFLKFIQGWLFSALVGVTVLVAVGHYLWGGIRPQGPGEKVTAQVKAHLSVLLGLIVLAKAWGYFLGRFDLLTSPRGVVTGASYTDVQAQLPALNFLILAAIVCAVLFLVNIRLRGWVFPTIGVALLGLTSVVAGALIPAAIQKFSVDPQELQKEQPFIERNIEFTRRAFGLDKFSALTPSIGEDLDPQDVEDNEVTIQNIRLWDPLLLREDYKQLQRIKQYYEFEDTDVDRYLIDGEKRVVMLSAREVSQSGIPEGGRTWQNEHLVYTHGFGVVASQVNSATAQGAPTFLLRDIPPIGNTDLVEALQEPRVYFGERSDVPFVMVKTQAKELDYQGTADDDQREVTYTYQGDGGIPVGGFFQRLLLSWRYRDVNLMISDLITPDSRIMIYRSIQQRVPKAAPFLKFDGDPYAAIVDGRIVWIWDAYTTTNAYPYSQEVSLAGVTSPPQSADITPLSGKVNYIRNSVKVVVDAYDGTMKYYVADENDPIIQVWRNAFPGMFTSLDDASEDLRSHFRYPENLFQVQATQFANYHVTDPSVFYQKQDFWAIPVDPTLASGASTPLRPYYVLMLLPGEQQEEFVLILPFTPQGRQNMVAWMAAKSDPEAYGEIVSFEFPAGRNVDGPTQVFNQINSFPEFSQERTLLGQGGSRVLFGNFMVIPLGDSFLYVQPVFVQANQANAFPELKRVVVVHGGTVGVGTTLDEAIADSFGGALDTGGDGSVPAGANVKAILEEALGHFERAEQALENGDLATYQKEIERARGLVRQASELSIRGEQGVRTSDESASRTTPTPTPSPVASP